MRSKRRTVCDACRKRKLGCDGASPQCTQCIFSGRTCPGYPQVLTIIQHKPASTDRSARLFPFTPAANSVKYPNDLPISHEAKCQQRSKSPSFENATYEELSNLIIENYVPKDELRFLFCNSVGQRHARICGSWVEALLKMDLPGKHYGVLFPAMKALCLTFVQRSQRDETEYVKTYCAVLSDLREALLLSSSAFEPDLAAASMCLTLCEVMLPTSKTGWMAHVKGVGDLIRRCGPGMLLDDINHSLFLGFRPLIVIEAFYSRKSTFLASEEWLTLPFSHLPATPMQSLLSCAAPLPSLLAKFDSLQQQHTEARDLLRAAQDIQGSFVQGLDGLECWKRSLVQTSAEPLYWSEQSSNQSPNVFHKLGVQLTVADLHFSDVSTANAFIHFWAFQIVCLTQLHAVQMFLADDNSRYGSRPGVPEGDVCQQILNLSTEICPSMAYLMQDDMKLYGPASTFFPLKVVHETLCADPIAKSSGAQRAWCQEIVSTLVNKGLGSCGTNARPGIHRLGGEQSSTC